METFRKNCHKILNLLPETAPRYTSYPPANYLHEFDSSDWIDSLNNELKNNNNLSVYVHIPFCKSLCFFCACNRVITKDTSVISPYLSSIISEIKLYKNILKTKPKLEQIHLGGGTPNFFSPQDIKTVINEISNSFGTNYSFSIELDPRTCTIEHLKSLSELNCSRISIGVQDFDPLVQKAINRIQSYEDTAELINNAKKLNIKNCAVDLIYGLPLQTRKSFLDTLEKVNQLKPNRIALYGYAHVQSVAPGQKAFNKLEIPNKSLRLDLLLDAYEYLTSNGYKFIGIDHFVLEDDPLYIAYKNNTLGRSFMGYHASKETPLLGIGCSAISVFPNFIVQNEKDVSIYNSFLQNNKIPITKGLQKTEKDNLVSRIIEELMTKKELSLLNFQNDANFSEIWNLATEKLLFLETIGLIISKTNELQLTLEGQFFARHLSGIFDYRLQSETQNFAKSLLI